VNALLEQEASASIRRGHRAYLAAHLLNGGAALLGNGRRIVLSLATALLALTSVGLGTYAGFSAQTVSPGNTFSTGTLSLTTTLGNPTSSSPFTFGTISDLVPGEAVVRFLDVTNTGSLDFTYAMASTATSSSTLDTDVTNSLQVEIKRCTVAWSGVDSCSGDTTTPYAGPIAPLAGTPVNLGAITAGAGNVAYLQLRVRLPSTATSLTGLTSTVQFTWTATTT
jgi:hypothetical protein